VALDILSVAVLDEVHALVALDVLVLGVHVGACRDPVAFDVVLGVHVGACRDPVAFDVVLGDAADG
jgi:hypothetical protein